MVIPYFKTENKQVIFTGKYMEAYLPYFYLDSKSLSTVKGNSLETIGIFTFKVFGTDDMTQVAKTRDKVQLKTFSFPGRITTTPSSQLTKSLDLLNLDAESEEEDIKKFMVLQYFENDIFIESTEIIKKVQDMVDFINLINSGKLPNTIAYDKLLELEINASLITVVNLGVTASTVELMLSELSRDPKNVNKPYRLSLGKETKPDLHAYRMASIKKIAALTSTFTALTFEDFNTSMVYSVNRGLDKDSEITSPVEKIIKY